MTKQQNKKGSKANNDKSHGNPPPPLAPRRSGRDRKQTAAGKQSDAQQAQLVVGESKLRVVTMDSDGNCLCRAFAHQLYGDEMRHSEVRADICDFFEAHPEDFKDFVSLGTEDGDDADDFPTYVLNMRKETVWGGSLEVMAAARLYGRKIVVYQPLSGEPLDFEPIDGEKAEGPPILLSFHDENHYNSLQDPKVTTLPPVIKTWTKSSYVSSDDDPEKENHTESLNEKQDAAEIVDETLSLEALQLS